MSAAYTLLEELDAIPLAARDEAQHQRKRRLAQMLQYILPLLQADVLEDAFCEPLSPSGFAALAHEATLLALDGGVPSGIKHAYKQHRLTAFAQLWLRS